MFSAARFPYCFPFILASQQRVSPSYLHTMCPAWMLCFAVIAIILLSPLLQVLLLKIRFIASEIVE